MWQVQVLIKYKRLSNYDLLERGGGRLLLLLCGGEDRRPLPIPPEVGGGRLRSTPAGPLHRDARRDQRGAQPERGLLPEPGRGPGGL